MANMIENLQDRVRTSTSAMFLMAVKVLTGLLIGLTIALIGDEIIGYAWFSFVLVMVVVTGALVRIMRAWSWVHVLIFNLVCLLVGLLLRMYILIAPGV